ncbi:MAG TPA: hypothetical protein VGV38_02395 [Pyrinomonadaceae bacterium]|nr:hypothetical protein [Pyrinomonadaceae bacterium]
MTEKNSFDGLRPLINAVPGPVRRAVKEAVGAYRLRRAVREFSNLAPGARPTRALLSGLRAGWGNEWYAARTDYLEELAARAVETDGPVLECGSGLTTLLLGLLAGRRGVEVWSLEHLPEWHARVAAGLARFDVPGVRAVLAPLRDYGGFDWYDPPLEEMPREFRLVVCDGPPGPTRGGRYGLLPVLGDRLTTDSLILLDDAERAGEREVLRRWHEEAALCAAVRETPTATFALVKKKR